MTVMSHTAFSGTRKPAVLSQRSHAAFAPPHARRHSLRPASATSAPVALTPSRPRVESMVADHAPVAKSMASSTDPKQIPQLTPDNFHMFIAEAGSNVVLVDFYTDWCGPCKVMSTEFEKLTGIFKNVKFAKFNLGKHEGAFANRLAVRSLPTFRFYQNGRIVDQVMGARPQELRQLLVHHNHPAFALQALRSVDEA